jgi:hypothetical protein
MFNKDNIWNASLQRAITLGLQRLSARPEWLTAALQSDRVLASLARHIPVVAEGALRLTDCSIQRLFLKDRSGRWKGTYQVTVEGLPGVSPQTIPLHVTLSAPGKPVPDSAGQPAQPFGSEGWSCYLPELGLFCELEPPEEALDSLERLTDPQESLSLLEESIRSGGPAYRDFRLKASHPKVLNYKPGSRCTIRYRLEYPPEAAGRGWPQAVIAKTYRGKKGEQAYQGMVELWNSPLASGEVVQVAEPLAYVPELRLLIQSQLAEGQILEELIRSAIRSGEPLEMERLYSFVRKSASGLAMVHLSGAQAAVAVSWEERFSDVPDLIGRLAVVAPDFEDLFQPLVASLQTLAAEIPPDPLAPSHGSFDGDQVLIDQDWISFIDFDSFCMAEPSLDVGHFRAAVMDSGMKLIDPDTLQDPQKCRAYLDRLAEIGEIFLEQYQAHAPVSRQRIALWEALDYLRDALHIWTKPKPTPGIEVIRILEYHLGSMGFLV